MHSLQKQQQNNTSGINIQDDNVESTNTRLIYQIQIDNPLEIIHLFWWQ
jgi:hypothetical protein